MNQKQRTNRTFIRPSAAAPAAKKPPPIKPGVSRKSATPTLSAAKQPMLLEQLKKLKAAIPNRVSPRLQRLAYCCHTVLLWSYFYLVGCRELLDFSTGWCNPLLPFKTPYHVSHHVIRKIFRVFILLGMTVAFGWIWNTTSAYFYPTFSANELNDRRRDYSLEAEDLAEVFHPIENYDGAAQDDRITVDRLSKSFEHLASRAERMDVLASAFHEALTHFYRLAQSDNLDEVASIYFRKSQRLRVLQSAIRSSAKDVPSYMATLKQFRGLLQFSATLPRDSGIQEELETLLTYHALTRANLILVVEFCNSISSGQQRDLYAGAVALDFCFPLVLKGIGMSTQPKISVGIDLGTKCCEVAVCDGSATPKTMTFPGEGELLVSAVFINGDDVMVGKAARTKAMKDPLALFTDFKRRIAVKPHEPVGGPGSPTAAEIMTHLIRHIDQVLQQTTPAICDYRPELGGKKDPELLKTVITVPAGARLDYRKTMEKCAQEAGLPIDGVLSESAAAGHTFRTMTTGKLKAGDSVAVFDLGGGTFDMSLLKFADGQFDQLAVHGDDNLGGLNFERVVFLEFCRQQNLPFAEAFDALDGLSSVHSKYTEQELRLIFEVAEKSAEAVRSLSVSEEIESYVNAPEGLLEFELNRAQFVQLCAEDGLHDRFDAAAAGLFAAAKCRPEDVDHIVFVGGAAPTYTLRDRLAAAVGRDVSEVFLPTDSGHAVARGAALTAMAQANVGMVLTGGLGVQLTDRNDPQIPINKLVIPTGTALPPDGMTVEELGQSVVARGGSATIRLKLIEAVPGVDSGQRNGGPLLMKPSEVVVIRELTQQVSLPAGEHRVQVGVMFTPSNKLLGRLSFPDQPDLDVITFEVTGDDDLVASSTPTDSIFGLDCSGSMERELPVVKEATYGLLEQLAAGDVRVALGRFGSDARIVANFDSTLQQVADATHNLEICGSTDMAGMLLEALELLEIQGDTARRRLTILLTDGCPDDADATVLAGNDLKQASHLVCIGVGPGVSDEYLRALATTPNDYYHILSASDLPDLFDNFLDLYFDI